MNNSFTMITPVLHIFWTLEWRGRKLGCLGVPQDLEESPLISVGEPICPYLIHFISNESETPKLNLAKVACIMRTPTKAV